GDDEDDSENEDVVVQGHAKPAHYAVERPFFAPEESDESELANSLSESISEVEQVYQDMGARRQSAEETADETEEIGAAPEVDIEDVVVIASHPVEQAESEIEAEAAVEEKFEAPEVESPYETEIDPITGVYRLKAKAPSAAPQHESQNQTTEGQHEHTHESHSHEHGSEHEQEEDWEGTQLTIPVYGQPEGETGAHEQQHQQLHHEHHHEHNHEHEGEDEQQHGHEHNQANAHVESEQQDDQDAGSESESEHMQPSWNS
ncbi:MAG TPA: hypothetical protein V6C97_14120, partial [Oculatellaceae cyanobacterium]